MIHRKVKSCDSYFTIQVNQTIMLHALNLYSDACQLFLNKTSGKNAKRINTGKLRTNKNLPITDIDVKISRQRY